MTNFCFGGFLKHFEYYKCREMRRKYRAVVAGRFRTKDGAVDADINISP